MGKEIKIKIRPHPDYPQLKVKHVGSQEWMCPKLGQDGKTLTGIDENSFDILSIEDRDTREARQKKVKTEREYLERILALDLRPESAYWDKFYITLDDEQTFDEDNAKHRLYLHFLIANKYVAPSLEEADSNQDYQNCVFYIYDKEQEISKSAKKKRILNKASAELAKLEENETRIKIVAAYIFGYDPKADLNAQEAFIKISDYLDQAEGEKNDSGRYERAISFVDVCSRDNNELMTKVVLDKAIATHTISVRGGVHKKGDLVFGNNYDEALEFLSDPANSKDLASLQREVAKKKK